LDAAHKQDQVDDRNGYTTYKTYTTHAVELVANNWVDATDTDSGAFVELLDRIRDRLTTQVDWQRVIQTCSQDSMSPQAWRAEFVEDTYVPYLFTNNAAVLNYNHEKLKHIGTPIVLIEVKHTGQLRQMNSKHFCGLDSNQFLAVRASVLIISNIAQHFGLCNGTVGVVKDIFLC
jgi:hypothetical protein